MTDRIARLRIELLHLDPCIWRSVDVSLNTHLRALHEIIQAVMPWQDYHLYEFAIGDRVYGEPDPEDSTWGRKVYQARSVRIGMIVDRGISDFMYIYDFGDDWQHRVVVEHVGPADPDIDYPRFVGGERTAPPEDVGGPPGFMEFVEAMAKPRHPQHKDMVRWYGGPFHPTEFGAAEIDAHVRRIAARRKISVEASGRSRAMRPG